MKKDSELYKKIKVRCYIVGLIAFLTALIVGVFLLHNLEKDEKTTGKYMAQITEKRVRARLDQYSMLSALLGNYISAGENLDENTFSELAEKIPNEDGVIKAFELAPEGIVTDIYPKQGNEGAFGLDVLREHEQKKDAILARDSGKYTLGGPYQLKQGGTGALLFNPVYQDNNSEQDEFWGFVILVIDWDRFIEEINLDYLSDADFCYRIWTYDRGSSDKIILAESQDNMSDNILTVECTVPNNTWYFDIIHSRGWIPRFYQIMCIVISCIFSLLIATVFYLISSKKHRERQYEAELEKSAEQAKNANEAKTRFLFNMSHDIRTPMNAIIGFTTLAVSNIDNKERVRDYLGKILSSSNHLLSLINDVLDMSRIESGKMHLEETEVNLSDLLHDLKTIIGGQIHAKQLELYMDAMDVTDEDVYCDKTRLNQVLLNLLSNAIKFTPAGGTVSVRLRQFPSTQKGCAKYEIRVKDNGIGMSQEFAQKIFDPFERERTSTVSKIQGTGLGMAISKNIVNMMGGTIEVQTEQGKGTEFIVCLPLRIQPKHHPIQKITELEGLKALVVDDDFNTCDSVTKMLVKVGMRSEWTLSGKEAILRAQQSTELGDAFHAYIIDWRLPDMNGIEVTRQIRSLGDDTPIIILTAYDWSDIEAEARAAGVTAFCTKPLFMSDLRENLLEAIGQKQAGTEKRILPAEGSDFKGKSILLVEDNELNSEIAVEILNAYGFLVDTAENGAEAVKKVKNSTPGKYDLVLMDVQMPVMNGYEATKLIRALDEPALAGITILAMTANAFDEDRKRARECGMDGFLSKPIVIEELIGTLRNNLV